MSYESKNIYENIPAQFPEELVDILAEKKGIRIERIISRGHKTDKDFWYDQDTTEFVIVLKGHAELLFEDSSRRVLMKPGEYINIPAHARHRVEWTSPDEETVWLAIHY